MARSGRFVVAGVLLAELLAIAGVVAVVGGWWTVGLLFASSLVGGVLMKGAGRRAMDSLRSSVAEGRPPDRDLGNAAWVFAGGLLMFLPGFVSSLVGIVVALPLGRPLSRRLVTWASGRGLAQRLAASGMQGMGDMPGMPGSFGPGGGPAGRGDSDGSGVVIQGDVISSRDSRYTGLNSPDEDTASGESAKD